MIASQITGEYRRCGVSVWCKVVVLCVMFALDSHAVEIDQQYEFNIDEETLAAVLDAVVEQSGALVLYPPKLANKTGMNPVKGLYTVNEALDLILQGSGFSGRITESSVIVVTTSRIEEIGDQEEAIMRNAENISSVKRRGLLAILASFLGVSVSAQDATQLDNEPVIIEEVIVTASKREQRIQDVSMSLTALGSKEIEYRGLVGMGDYLSSVPSVSVLDQAAGKTAIVIRGLAANPQNELAQGPTVGVYFGETPISGFGIGGHTADIKMVDLERVEVL